MKIFLQILLITNLIVLFILVLHIFVQISLFFDGQKKQSNSSLKTLKNVLLLAFVAFFFTTPVSALTLQASVEYTVDSARVEAFANIPAKLSKTELQPYKKDYLNNTHLYLISANKTSCEPLKVKKIVPFYINSEVVAYGIQYCNNPSIKYYYTKNGYLFKYEIVTGTSVYPYKTVTYTPTGRLDTINLVTSESESFIFNKHKDLLVHWKNNIAYDKDGKETNVTRRF